MVLIRRNEKAVLMLCLCLFLSLSAFFRQPVYAEAGSKAVQVSYFYISACSSCHDTEEYLAGVSDRCTSFLKEKNIDLLINKYNTAEDENLNLLQTYLKKYNVPEKEKDLPIVFFDKTYISGEKAIKARFEKELLELSPEDLSASGEVKSDKDAAFRQFSSFRVLSTFAVGFANGLTPCSLSMLLFFISLLLARDINVIKMGLLYCAGKFVTYLLLGTLLFKTLGSINTGWLGSIIKILMLTAIVIFIFLNAMDFIAAKGERYDRIRLQLPARVRGLNHKWIKAAANADSPVRLFWISLLLGVLTSVGEFLCTGQIYLTTILYVLHSNTNLAFIAPLVIITLLIFKGRELLDVSEFIRRNMHYIKLINIIVFLLLGIFLFFNL
ncbi:MAG: cytochrome c biosis protein [Eubacterium sp.]|nr:cytochrome c biosis protein [Eubacterium sp.]